MDEKKDINDLVNAGFPHECAVLLRSKTSSFGDKSGYWYTTRNLSLMPEDHLKAVFEEKHLGYKLYVKAFQNNKTFLRCEGGSPKQQLVSLGLSDATASIMADNFCIDGTSFCWLEQANLEEIFPTRNYWGLLTEAQMQLKLVKEKMKLEKQTSEMSLPRSDDTTGTSAGSSAAVALPQILPTSGSSAPDNSLPENKAVSLPTEQFDERDRILSRRHLRSNKTTTHAERSQDGLMPEEKVKTEVGSCIGDFNAAPTVYKCCISHCGYHSAQQYCADVSLFSFPKAPLAAIEWLEFAERCNNGSGSTSICKEKDFICSRHFLANSLTRRRNVVQLKSQFGPFFPKADEMDDKTLEDQTDPSTQSARERPRKRKIETQARLGKVGAIGEIVNAKPRIQTKTQIQERSRKSGATGVIVDAKPRIETFKRTKKQERMRKVGAVGQIVDATLRIARRAKRESVGEEVSGVAAVSHQNSKREENAAEMPSAGLVKRRRKEKTLPNSNREETAAEIPSARRGKRKPPFDPSLLKHLIEAVGGDANLPIPTAVSPETKMDVDDLFSPDSPDATMSHKLEAPVNKRAVAVVRPTRASASVKPVTAETYYIPKPGVEKPVWHSVGPRGFAPKSIDPDTLTKAAEFTAAKFGIPLANVIEQFFKVGVRADFYHAIKAAEAFEETSDFQFAPRAVTDSSKFVKARSLKLEAPVNKRADAVVRSSRASASVPPVTATNPATAKLLKSPQVCEKRNTQPEPMADALGRAQAVYKNVKSMMNKVRQATEFEVAVRIMKKKKRRCHKYFANSADLVKDYLEGAFPDDPEIF